MTEVLLLCCYMLITYPEQIFAACLIGVVATLCGLEMGAVAFVFFVFK